MVNSKAMFPPPTLLPLTFVSPLTFPVWNATPNFLNPCLWKPHVNLEKKGGKDIQAFALGEKNIGLRKQMNHMCSLIQWQWKPHLVSELQFLCFLIKQIRIHVSLPQSCWESEDALNMLVMENHSHRWCMHIGYFPIESVLHTIHSCYIIIFSQQNRPHWCSLLQVKRPQQGWALVLGGEAGSLSLMYEVQVHGQCIDGHVVNLGPWIARNVIRGQIHEEGSRDRDRDGNNFE